VRAADGASRGGGPRRRIRGHSDGATRHTRHSVKAIAGGLGFGSQCGAVTGSQRGALAGAERGAPEGAQCGALASSQYCEPHIPWGHIGALTGSQRGAFAGSQRGALAGSQRGGKPPPRKQTQGVSKIGS
jgi:hypothetical protein